MNTTTLNDGARIKRHNDWNSPMIDALRKWWPLALAGFAVALAGCGGGGAGTVGGTTGGGTTGGGTGGANDSLSQAVKAAQGGNLQTPDGRVTVEIPAGALSADTTININQPSRDAGGFANYITHGKLVNVEGNGVSLLKDVILKIKFDAFPEGALPENLSLAIDTGTGIQRLNGLEIDSNAKVIRAKMRQLGRFGIVLDGALPSGVDFVEMRSGTHSFGIATEEKDGQLSIEIQEDGTIQGGGMELPSGNGLAIHAKLGSEMAGKRLGVKVEAVTPEVYTQSFVAIFDNSVPLVETNEKGEVDILLPKFLFNELYGLLVNAKTVSFRLQFFDPDVTRAVYRFPTWFVTLSTVGSTPPSNTWGQIMVGEYNFGQKQDVLWGTANNSNQPLRLFVYVKPDGHFDSNAWGNFEAPAMALTFDSQPVQPNGLVFSKVDNHYPIWAFNGQNDARAELLGSAYNSYFRKSWQLDANGQQVEIIDAKAVAKNLRDAVSHNEFGARVRYYVKEDEPPIEIWITFVKCGRFAW